MQDLLKPNARPLLVCRALCDDYSTLCKGYYSFSGHIVCPVVIFQAGMVCCRRPHVLLGVSGSVAAIKVPLIAKLLADFCDVVVIATDASRKLLAVDQLEAMHLPVKGASPFSTS